MSPGICFQGVTFLVCFIFLMFKLHNYAASVLSLLSKTIGQHEMFYHVFQMSSSFLCFPAKCKQEKELLTSHGMHRFNVHMNFLLKSHLYVVLRPMNTMCHKLRRKTQVCHQLSHKLSNLKQPRVCHQLKP
jgi:hypothetical protein